MSPSCARPSSKELSEIACSAPPSPRWRAPLNAAFARFPEVEPATLTGFLAALTEELKGLMPDA